MLAFKTQGGAEFGFAVDFTEHAFANMSFFGADRKNILFHMSLRQTTGKAAVNLRADGVWGAEILHDVSLALVGDKVLIKIDDTRIVVFLNDYEICAFDDEFPNLGTIESVNYNGGITPASVLIGGPANEARIGEGQLALSGFMDVEGWGVDPGLPDQDVTVIVTDLEEPIPVTPVAHPEIAQRYRQSDPHVGVFASLPGRIWEGVEGSEKPLLITLYSNGIPCGDPLELTRSVLLRRIEALCATSGPSTFDMLLAVEHVRFANILAELSGAAKSVLMDAAQLYGVSEYLLRSDLDTSEAGVVELAPEFDVKVHPNQMLLRTAQSRFGMQVAANTQGKPLIQILQNVLKDFPLPPQVEKFLFLSLTEAFCTADSFEDLYAFVLPRLSEPFVQEKAAWHNSNILPFLVLDKRYSEVKDLLWALAEPGEGWIVTPAVAWALQFSFKGAELKANEKTIEEIVYAFQQFIERRSGQYWERTPCQALTETAVVLTINASRFTDYLRDQIPNFVLKNFGLSSTFWRLLNERVETEGFTPAAQMVRAGKDFQRLATAKPGDIEGITTALRPFRDIGHRDATRYTRELVNPGLHAGSAAQLEDMLYANPSDYDDAIVRAVAAPNAPNDAGKQNVTEIRHAVQRLYATVPRSPYLGVQERLGQSLPALVRDTEKSLGLKLPDVISDLARTSVQRSKYIGLGLTLRMIPALEAQGKDELAMRMLSHVGELRSSVIPAPQHQDMFDSSAVQSALAVLHAMASDSMPLTQSTLNLFPNATSDKMALSGKGLSGHALAPLYSTLVVVFSCRPFLDTRVEAMRQSWLAQLADYGVPYVVVVGDGDGQQEGDVVYLDAPDSYEGLPQKTLAAIEWALKNTDATHIYKIDDDCVLDPAAFFGNLNHLKHDYFGRTIKRHVGGMNRTWHFEKSKSARGTKELDKSPEPSTYCDGGSGYLLSRRAMHAVIKASEKREGQQITRSAFMEDKLVGDLLALEGISPSNEDYRISVQRRTHSDAVPVSRWENSFHPSPLSGVHLVHLDTHETQAEVTKACAAPRLWPRKLWPTYTNISLGNGTNLLELVSPEAKLKKLNAEPLAAVACVRNEMFMLPHFLAHYRKLGVKAFLISDNCSDDGTLEYLLEQPDVVTFSADTNYGESQYGVAWQMTLIANLRVGRWSLIVDADELLVYPNWKRTSLPKLLGGKTFKDADAARIYMLDMYPQGPLSEADFASGDPFKEAGFVDQVPFLRESVGRGPFSNSDTVTSALRHRLLPWSRPELFVAQKYALLKYQPWMRPSAGFHYVGDIKPSETELIFAHFKYTAQFRQKALDEVTRGQHFNNAEEYRKYLALMSEGREVIYDADVSVPWEDSDPVKRIMSGK
ncbi:glycosyltransferase family 2 protein [Tateyamaria sp.]|uniref:glycosyltransferase family 2 protein n=1 Tax=Tateyamaria sp. TaxID=1929288 RepID=UPI00329B5F2C